MNHRYSIFFAIHTFLLFLPLTTITAEKKRLALQAKLKQKHLSNVQDQHKKLQQELHTIKDEHKELQQELHVIKQKMQDPTVLSENLISACLEKNTSRALQMIQNGAQVNYKANIKSFGLLTPLHIACLSNNSDLSKRLIDHGADPYHPAVVKIDGKNCEKQSPWFIVCDQGFTDIGDYMIKKVPNIIFSCSHNGYSGLHISIEKQRSNMAEKIIAADKEKILINKQTTTSLLTPLGLATMNNDIERMDILIKNGAFIDHPFTSEGITPLLYAVTKNNCQVAEYLLKNGANPNISFDISYLEHCCVLNRVEMGKLLITYGADINVEIKQGISIVCVAILLKNSGFLTMLLDAGANKDITTKQNISLLNCVEYVNNPQITQLLEERGICLISQKAAEIKKDSFFETVNQNIICQDNTIIPIPDSTIQEQQLPSKTPVSNKPAPQNASTTNPNRKKIALKSQPQQRNTANNKEKEVSSIQTVNASAHHPIKYTILQDKNLKWPRSLSTQQEQNLTKRLAELHYFTDLKDDITPLKGELAGKLRLRVGGHRVIFSVNHEKHEITIHTIKLRKNVYK